MKILLNEPISAKYLHISEDNIIYILMPVVSGTRIGLDNTCKAVLALQDFFGKKINSNPKIGLKNELLAYKEALQCDLSILSANALVAERKQARLMQIDAYLTILINLENDVELECLKHNHPSYPRPLEELMQDRTTSNLYSIVLRPTNEDGFLRCEGANPIFSVAHQSTARGIEEAVSPLQQALIEAYSQLEYVTSDLKSQVIQQVLTQPGVISRPINFTTIRGTLQDTVETELNVSVDFSKSEKGVPVNQQYIESNMNFDPLITPAHEYIDALLGYCAPNLFDTTTIESPFNSLIDAESWSIATQFLLGMTNFYCLTQDNINPDTNFGQILDNNPNLSASLATTLAQAQREKQNIEATCLSWMNSHTTELQLKTPLTASDIKAIKTLFAERYAEIKSSPHFDEFFLFNASKKGHFFIHQGSICTLFTQFASSPILNLDQELLQPLENVRLTANTLSTELPHNNPLVESHIDIDTATLDDTALQALYEHINRSPDHHDNKQLLAQLKQERPDFKPQINAKPFLQHIAYGEQDEAEKLLARDPDLTQALLMAHDIPFTDYSGRTFTCTAYEYAYWAKDAHMLKMLERYLQHNDETRQFIFERVKAIEAPVMPASSSLSSWFFSPPQPRPRGLHYTRNDSKGETTDHWEAHFDLTPLKQALTFYIAAFNQRPSQKSDSDWKALDEIWLTVGPLQRDVPAHIAQEYCHPERSFLEVSQNTALLDTSIPSNLTRQLTYYNYKMENNELWFTRDVNFSHSEFGVSCAILRGMVHIPYLVSGPRVTIWCCCDLSVLEALDNIRTHNLEQSVKFLSQSAIQEEHTALSLCLNQ